MSICVKLCLLPRSIAVAFEQIPGGFGVTALKLHRKSDQSVAFEPKEHFERHSDH